ncbi:1-aminocyclopropane-1-carboxylate deaminase [Thalassotalea insulae]|uniref:1-aminocyclopropane-1-carboxylate deaminase n=1 Tax=Thalassotalea insulae TaxID=2056778 RepID=A0ABQ6GPN1_9GAMM|nr:pyridoxal-phosphate dependent enzyme [Thalassotalea insulae]GLX77877.1 1-aminocyclopropane-1-carboxylate deaminase [Thalassotalea insulae]
MTSHSPIQRIAHPLFEQYQLTVDIKRDDLLHPVISGNKWRKLKYNIKHLQQHNYQGIVSFGGGYSNHIHALAYAGHYYGFATVGVIRGEAHYANNYSLQCAQKWGMELKFIDRKSYRQKTEASFLEQLQQQYRNYFIVPEGGSNQLALPGVAEVCQELNQQTNYDTLITPVGSAGTLAGLITGDNNQHQLLGIAVLKQGEYLVDDVKQLIPNTGTDNNWQILTQYHCGGYAKFSQQDLAELKAFSHITGVPFEPIYSGKMILALLDLIKNNTFAPGHHIVLLHTGGLQGLAGLAEQNKLKADEWPLPPGLQVL